MLGMNADTAHFMMLLEHGASLREWLSWAFSSAAPAILAGLAAISVVAAAIGYLVASLGWRWWIARKWRRRMADRTA
jgi:uncharacterized protein (DUF2062 family)